MQEFHDHWRHPHGTLARNITTIRSYVQSHQLPSDLLGPDQSLYDGVPEVSWESEGDGSGLATHPVYVRDLIPDEPKFIDMQKIFFLFTQEEVLQTLPDPNASHAEGDQYWREDSRATAIKLLQFIRTDDEASLKGDDDVVLGRRLGAFRQVRCRRYAPLHPDGHEFVGVREIWWPTLTHFQRGVAADRAAFDSLRQRAAASLTLLAVAERFL